MSVFPRYPDAEWVPWRPTNPASGRATYYANVMSTGNLPDGAVLHIMEGYSRTARDWALNGHYGASWHFSVGRDGHVMQHLDLEHGGFHAGITAEQAAWRPPVWRHWRGPQFNVNWQSIGIEHEGFITQRGFTEQQFQASVRLCRWLADQFGWEWGDRSRFPAHAEIDRIHRLNDFGYPDVREAHYQRMFASAPPPTQEVDEVTREEVEALLVERDARIAALETRLERVNGALVNRMWLRRIADDPNYSNVEAVMALLYEEGIIS